MSFELISSQFGGTASSRNPLSYCLLIISFVLAWVETWFMDFKVLPWERRELQRYSGPVPSKEFSFLLQFLLVEMIIGKKWL